MYRKLLVCSALLLCALTNATHNSASAADLNTVTSTTTLSALNTTNAPQNLSDANVTGHVVSTEGEHLPYVTIAVDGTTIGAATDATGHFFLKNLPAGKFTVTASMVGYTSQSQEVEFVKGVTSTVNFTLEEQSVMMDQVVVSATRNETNKREVGTIVNVLSDKTFKTVEATNISEALSFQPGVRMEQNCQNCGFTQMRINGMEGPYSQILMDSRPIFSSLAGVYGLEMLPTSMIERVEVIRGGGSALFGSNAIAGVLNIITKEPLRNSLKLTNTTGFNPDGGADVNTSIGASLVSDDHRAGAYVFGQVRDRDAYDHNDDGFSDVPLLASETFGFRTYYKPSPYTKITAEYHHMHEFRRGGDQLDVPPHEAYIAEQLNHKIDGGGLTFNYFSPDARHNFSLYTSAQSVSRDSYYGTGQNPNAYGNTRDLTYVAGTQYTYHFNKLLFMPANLSAGGEFNYNNLHDQQLGYGRDMYQMVRQGGMYLQNEWKNEKLSVLLGGRLDKHNMVKKAVLSPRANVRYTPVKAVALRASYSSGYRAPQAFDEDLHISSVGGDASYIVSDPNLKPEYSHSWSGSVDLYSDLGGDWQGNLLVEGFYTKLNDVFTIGEYTLDSEGNMVSTRYNASGATVKGVNLEARAGLPGVIDIQAGFTFQTSLYEEAQSWAGDDLATRTMLRTPDQYGFLTIHLPLAKKTNLSVFGTYTGHMLVGHSIYIDEDTTNDINVESPSFFDMGLRVGHTFDLTGAVGLELFAGVKNLFNEYQNDLDRGMYRDSAYFYGPMSPRNIFFGVSLNL